MLDEHRTCQDVIDAGSSGCFDDIRVDVRRIPYGTYGPERWIRLYGGNCIEWPKAGVVEVQNDDVRAVRLDVAHGGFKRACEADWDSESFGRRSDLGREHEVVQQSEYHESYPLKNGSRVTRSLHDSD